MVPVPSGPAPTPLATLRSSATNYPDPSEFNLRYWLNSADDVLSVGLEAWLKGRDRMDQRKVETAYKELRKGAELLRLIKRHPAFPTLSVNPASRDDHARYKALQAKLFEASRVQPEISAWLEQREREWNLSHDRQLLEKLEQSPTPSEETVGRFIDSYGGVNSSLPVASTSSPSPPPLTSVASRLAALRSHGLPTATTISHGPKPPPPPKPLALQKPNVPTHSAHLDPIERPRSLPPPPLPPSPKRNGAPLEELQTTEDGDGAEAALYSGSHFPSLTELEQDFERAPSRSPRPVRGPLPAVPPHPPPPPPQPQHTREPATTTLSSIRPPPTKRPSASALPFATEVLPKALYEFLSSPAMRTEGGSRVLLLDVRSREEWDAGRIEGEGVCLEPVGLRHGITSSQIEASLVMAPRIEQDRFAARSTYDLLIVYDRSSSLLPTSPPPSTSSESQKILWNLMSAIYENEFRKSLVRQPVLLKGGWEAWIKELGGRGTAGASAGALDREEEKRRNRSVRVVPASGEGAASLVRTSRDVISYAPAPAITSHPPSDPSTSSLSSASLSSSSFALPSSSQQPLFSPTRPQASQSGYFSPYSTSSYTTNGTLSPRLGGASGLSIALPPVAASRPGTNYDYGGSPGPSGGYARPSYPQQPSYVDVHSGVGNSIGLSQSYGASNGYSPATNGVIAPGRIDYPTLGLSQHPSNPVSSRPPPPAPIARPAAIQPAPLRSNSFSQSYLQPAVGTGHTLTKSQLMSFGGEAIGLTGLKNLGNTCYMNSTIQCLSATIPFARYFKEGSYKRDVNTTNKFGTKGALADAVSELIGAIWAQKYTFLSPLTFRENICRFAPQFRGSDQHDAQEFLGFLLDGLHEDLNYVQNKPPPVEMSVEREHDLETLPQQVMSQREWDIYRRRDDSFVVQCFQGQFRNQLRCLTCGKTSTTYNTFMPLSVPVPSGRGIVKVSLLDCIQAFVKEEVLDKDDMWNCPRCKVPRKATKKLTLSRLPPILVIHLKRFSFKGPFSDKIETQVQFPLSGLDLTNFMPPPLLDPKAPPVTSAPKGYVYDLYGVTNHFGNLSSGHYTAYVKSHSEWNNVDDSKVSPIDPSTARNAYILYFALRP